MTNQSLKKTKTFQRFYFPNKFLLYAVFKLSKFVDDNLNNFH